MKALGSKKKFKTANGTVCATHEIQCVVDCLNHGVSAIVLDKCPPVVSLGKLVEQGYRFEWKMEGEDHRAILQSPDGSTLNLSVEGRVPVLAARRPADAEQKPSGTPNCACPGSSVEGQGISEEGQEDDEKEEDDWEVDDENVDEGEEDDPFSDRKLFNKLGKRREAAGTRLHALTHMPMNKYCKVCQHVKLVASPARKIVAGCEKIKSERFGDLIHMDHMFADVESVGVEGETCALILLDDFTGFRFAYPYKNKSGESVVCALRHFIGKTPLSSVAVKADNTQEFDFAVRMLGIAWYKSTPRRHQSNGKVERCVRAVTEGTRCALYQAGLGVKWWPLAMQHAAAMQNVFLPHHEKEKTPWLSRMGEDFVWKVEAFGAKARAIIRGSLGHSKFDPNTRAALFMGWQFAPGFVHVDYRVIDEVQFHDSWAGEPHVFRTVDVVINEKTTFLEIGRDGEKQASIREVTQELSDDRTKDMLDQGIIEVEDVLSLDQKEAGWRVDRFGDRLVKVPPRSSRPPWLTPEDWRALPQATRQEIARERQDSKEGGASSSTGLTILHDRSVWFAGDDKEEVKSRAVSLEEVEDTSLSCVFGEEVVRIVLEICCDEGSILGSRCPPDCGVVRVSLQSDINVAKNREKIKEVVKNCRMPLLVWISTPCTTGCPWHRTNPSIAEDRAWQEKHRTDMETAKSAKAILDVAINKGNGCACVWEWPKGCDHWKHDIGESILQHPKLEKCEFDGCSYGCMSDGALVQKPWRIMTNARSIVGELNGRLCSKRHVRQQCRGRVASESGGYNATFADCMHSTWRCEASERACRANLGMLAGNLGSECVNRGLEQVIDDLEKELSALQIPLAPQRTNVTYEGGSVRSVLLGAYTVRGAGVTSATSKKKWDKVIRLVHEAARFRGDERAGQGYASIQITQASPEKGLPAHVDSHNEGLSDILVLGNHEGGRLRVNDQTLECHRRWACFDGKTSHWVEPYSGTRWSVILYNPVGQHRIGRRARKELKKHGFSLDEGTVCAEGNGSTDCGENVQDQGYEKGFCGSEWCDCRDSDHREFDDYHGTMWSALITRQIWPNEAEFQSKACQEALRKELEKLTAKQTWDPSTVQEYGDVVKGRFGKAIVGRAFAIMGEKNAESLNPDEHSYKGRIVFQGNCMKASHGMNIHEVFQEVSNTPANMTIARTAIGVGLACGMSVTVRDVSQAYLQSNIDEDDGTSTWVSLPRAWWPAEWFDERGDPKYSRPVCRLRKALYGHPQSDRKWEKYLGSKLRKLGWRPSEGNPGTWLRELPGEKGLNACLVTYVDDLLLIAPKDVATKFWRDIEKEVEFKESEAPIGRYLGANHHLCTLEGGDCRSGKMEVEMKGYLADAVTRFEQELGSKLRRVHTPYVSDQVWNDEKLEGQPGKFSESAASYIATLLFLARMSRPDLLTSVIRLSRWVSKWDRVHDAALIRLFGYVKHSSEAILVSEVAELPDSLKLVVWSDADLNSDCSDSKSTSGVFIEIESHGDRVWPVTWVSKRQGASAYATCEAEIVALNVALREEAIPMLNLMEAMLGRSVSLSCREDNTQAIAGVRRGYSKKLRHIERTQRVSLGALHEMLCGDGAVGEIVHHPTDSHKGDIFTKVLDRQKFEAAVRRIGVVSNSSFGEGGDKILARRSPNMEIEDNASPLVEDACCCMDRYCDFCASLYL